MAYKNEDAHYIWRPVIAELTDVRVLYVCEHCKQETSTRDATTFRDHVRKVESIGCGKCGKTDHWTIDCEAA